MTARCRSPKQILLRGTTVLIFQFCFGDDRFLKNSTLKWCGDRPRGGRKGVIPGLRKLALGGASWYLIPAPFQCGIFQKTVIPEAKLENW